jgi:hypothetical protein
MWKDQIPERQNRILQMIYESVAHHVGLHQQSSMGSIKAVANPHKRDLDDLDDIEGYAEIQSKVCSGDVNNA